MSMPNVQNIATVIGYLTLFENNHDQGVWTRVEHGKTAKEIRENPSCGTTGCAAGWAAFALAPDNARFVPGEGGSLFIDGDIVSVSEFATEELGLSYDQRSFVFYQAVDTKDVINSLKYIVTHPRADLHDLLHNLND